MKYECGVVRDLLPLYQDHVCSEESSHIVKEHLLECSACADMARKLENDMIDRSLREECEQVVEKHVRHEKKRSFLVGISLAAILMIPVIVCLICNIAIGHSLDWFFIVLASLMVFASITVVPLVAEEKKGLYTIISFTVSLLLLLLVTCIYSHGTWFMIAATAVVFGLSVVFLPYVMYQLPKSKLVSCRKGLIVMCTDTLLLCALIFLCGGRKTAFLITGFCLLLPWGIFLIARYLKTDRLTKAGIITILCGLFTGIVNDVIAWICKEPEVYAIKDANLLDWSNYRTINGNIYLIILISAFVAGAILILTGQIRGRKRSPNAAATCATLLPILPIPMMPIVLPQSSIKG